MNLLTGARCGVLVFIMSSSIALAHCSSSSAPLAAGASDAGAVTDASSAVDTDSAPTEAGFDAGTVTWTLSQQMHVARAAHTATLLPNGDVLVIGGEDGSRRMLDSIELYDPSVGWTEIGHLPSARSNHTATLLQNGKVLVVGGGQANDNGLPAGQGVTDSVVIVDPAATGAGLDGGGLVTVTSSLEVGRSHHIAALLPSGEVLVAGGASSAADGGTTAAIADAEVYDPVQGTWRTVGALATSRAMASATVVGGKVLVVGGFTANVAMPKTAELYDPATSAFTSGGTLAGAGRIFHGLTTLASGDALVVAGISFDGQNGDFLDETETMTAGAWKTTGELATPRDAAVLVPLADGRALAIGGYALNPAFNGPLSGVEIYEPSQRQWYQLATLKNARSSHSATLMPSGHVLVCGGTGSLDVLATCEESSTP